MVNKQAVVEYPPRTEEFDLIMEANCAKRTTERKKKGSKARARKYSTSSSSDDSNSKNKHVIVNITQPSLVPPARRYSNPTSPSKASTKLTPIVELLRKAGYTPNDYNDKALRDYFKWCSENLPGDFDKAFELLSKHDIGIDVLDSVADASALSNWTKLRFGTASRILKHYREWLDSLIDDDSN